MMNEAELYLKLSNNDLDRAIALYNKDHGINVPSLEQQRAHRDAVHLQQCANLTFHQQEAEKRFALKDFHHKVLPSRISTMLKRGGP